jgi:predicted AlkP superfamily pyrophosphatase or phosphodiesterase
VQRAGGRTAIATAETVGLLLDRHVDHGREKNCVTLFAGKSLPREALAPIADALGPFPSAHLQQDAWTTKALTDVLWKGSVPAFSILWLGEPDLTQHESAPGAPPALAAIKSSDKNLTAVLSALDRQGVRDATDVFVVSDHGPTILRILGIAAPQKLDGRILSEAMANIDMPALKPETKTLEAAKDFSSGTWRQSLQISRVGSTIYLDEGNGAFVPKR